MTNEEAFEKWFKENYPDVLPDKAWQAAISYMQEHSDDVARVQYDMSVEWNPKLKEDLPAGTKLYTTPQRQQPLKQLSDGQLGEITRAWTIDIERTPRSLANAIMDEMERINK